MEGRRDDGVVVRLKQIERQPIFLVCERVTFTRVDRHAAISAEVISAETVPVIDSVPNGLVTLRLS